MVFREYRKKRDIIQRRLKEFSEVSENDYFYELCFCLLTPGSKARQAEKVVRYLKERDFKNENVDINEIVRKVRFHHTKKKRLLELKKNYFKLHNEIIREKDSFKLREFLVKNIDGIGYKEASHFLRNIGRRDLAILDRHILKNMIKYNALDNIPNSLTKKRYIEIENKLRKFAKENNITIDELDLLFWSFETGEVFK
jgi:N-glycosylase/DNA lyase